MTETTCSRMQIEDVSLNVKIMLMNSGVLKTKRKCE